MKKWPIALATAIILTAGTAVALPAISAGTAKTISGCVNKKTGVLRVAKTCSKSETRLIWNAQGQPGLDGKDGFPGAAGSSGSVGPRGLSGEAGLSAFKIAENNGFTGTEEEWLASLQASAVEATPVLRSANFFENLPVWNNDTDLYDNANPIVSFGNLSPGTYALDYAVSFQNHSTAPGLVECYFRATNPAEKNSKIAGSTAPMRFLLPAKPPASEYPGYDDSKHALIRVFNEGDFSIRCIAVANDLNPEYTSTEITLRIFWGSLIKVGGL